MTTRRSFLKAAATLIASPALAIYALRFTRPLRPMLATVDDSFAWDVADEQANTEVATIPLSMIQDAIRAVENFQPENLTLEELCPKR